MRTIGFVLSMVMTLVPAVGHAAGKAKLISAATAKDHAFKAVTSTFKVKRTDLKSVKLMKLEGADRHMKSFIVTGPVLSWAGGERLRYYGHIDLSTKPKGKRVTRLSQMQVGPPTPITWGH